MTTTTNTGDARVWTVNKVGRWIEIGLLPSSFVHSIHQSAVFAFHTESERQQLETGMLDYAQFGKSK